MTLQGKTILALFAATLCGALVLALAHGGAGRPAEADAALPLPAAVVAPAHAAAPPRATAAELKAYEDDAPADGSGS